MRRLTFVACILLAAAGAGGWGSGDWPGSGSRLAETGQSAPPPSQTSLNQTSPSQSSPGQGIPQDDGLVIEPGELPATYPHGQYQVAFHPRGKYVPVLQWKVLNGVLPPGIKLEDNGGLRGEAERAGEYHFTLLITDGGSPQQKIRKDFVIKVMEAMTVTWKVPAHVTGNRIDGSVEVSNATLDDIDLTFDVKAVAEDGRATEIGYQHFPLKKGTIGMALPFGETLPHGAYVVRVDVVGEVAKHNAIYREGMQAPGRLQVVVGP